MFSPLYASVEAGSLLNAFSVSSVKYVQLTFLKLIKVLFSLIMGLISVARVITMGRWSEPRLVNVSHEAYGSRARLAREMSGEDDCPLDGSLVGVSSFRVLRFEFPISSEVSVPLVSLSWVNQRGSCALKSPNTKQSVSGMKGVILGV